MAAKYYNIYRASKYGDCLEKVFVAYCDEVTLAYLLDRMNATESGYHFAMEDGTKIYGTVEDLTDETK